MKDMKTMKKLLLIAILIIVPFNLLAGDFWKYLWGPEGGTIRDLFSLNGRIFIDTYNGYFRSDNFGRSWKSLYNMDIIGSIMGTQNDSLYSYYYDRNDEIKETVIYFRYSNDNGDNWTDIEMEDYFYSITENDPTLKMDINGNIFGVRKKIKDSIVVYSFEKDGSYKQLGNWQNPYSKDFVYWDYDIEENGNIVIFGYVKKTYEGFIFISPDSGRSWEYIEAPKGVFDIQFPNENKIVITTIGGGVFYSENHGETWITTSVMGSSKYLYRNTKDELFANGSEGEYNSVYKSVDSGRTWQRITEEGKDCYFDKMIAGENGEMYAGNSRGFYYSTDGGANWISSNKGFVASNVNAINFDSRGDIYAVALHSVFKSSDDGETWTDLQTDPIYSLAPIFISKDDIILTIYFNNSGVSWIARSTDYGQSWDYLPRPETYNVDPNNFFENNRGHIFIGHDFTNSLVKSTDRGITWTDNWISGGNYSYGMNSEGHIFRGSIHGQIYRSTDDGDTWEEVVGEYELFDHDHEGSGEIREIIFDKYSNGYSYFGISTTDNGRTWFIDEDKSDHPVRAIDSTGRLLSIMGIHPYRMTSNNNSEWEYIPSGLLHGEFNHPWNDLAVSPNGYIYLALKYAGLYRSNDQYVSVENEKDEIEAGGISLSPCPASDYIDLKFKISAIAPANISVYNQLGAKVCTNTTFSSDTGHNTSIPLRGFPSGIYYIRIETGNDIISGIFVKE